MALKQYFYIVLVPLKFIPKRTASFWQTIKIPNRFVLKICTGGFADYTNNRFSLKSKPDTKIRSFSQKATVFIFLSQFLLYRSPIIYTFGSTTYNI